MKNIAILGSTGSIGRNTLDVIRNLNKNGFPVRPCYLTAHSNSKLLCEQIDEFKPDAVAIMNEAQYKDINSRYSNSKCEILHGRQGIKEIIIRDNYDLLVNALVGFSGLAPTLEAIRNGKNVALANKESLVVAGELISHLIEKYKTYIIPIDSEHSAILQCIQGESINKVTKIMLTASGGPFLNFTKEQLGDVSVEQALNHPNWKMGNKITIDSATLMNKGFEIIEGKWLFNLNVENIEVIIHPQSIVHSLVEFADGSVKAQLGIPDMKIPIQYAITFPDRIASNFPRLDLNKLKSLTFFQPDLDKFECLKLAFEVIKLGGTYPVVLNASNEVAVDMFLKKKIRFSDISGLIKLALDKHVNHFETEIEGISEIDKWSREVVKNSVMQYN